MTEVALKVEGVGKSFKDKRIVKDISFEVRKGEILAILGPNGAGKSTTIRSIMGIMYPDEGSVTFRGLPTGEIPKNKIGYLPEERGLYKKVPIMDIILYFAELKDYPKKKARERALYYLKKLGLEGKEKSTIEEFSKGMGQKVQFIASIIHEPELLILDEPFSGLDPVSQDVMKNEIKELAQAGTAILLSAHQMNVVEELCDRLFMIHRGEKVVYGKLDEVKAQFGSYKCTVRGENKIENLEQLPQVHRAEQDGEISSLYLQQDINPAQWLRQLPESINIQELSISRTSLHEIFIDIATDKNLLERNDLDA